MQMREEQEEWERLQKPDARWMDEDTRDYMFDCMKMESSAVLTIDPDHHERMTCRQVPVDVGVKTEV